MLPDLPKAESQTVEFKTNFNEDVPQTLTAFANAKGGSVFVGVGDSGEVKGISLGRETLVGWLNEIKLKTTPQLIPEVDELDVDGREDLSWNRSSPFCARAS